MVPLVKNLIQISKGAVNIGKRAEINFIEGSNVTLQITDEPSKGRVNIKISAIAQQVTQPTTPTPTPGPSGSSAWGTITGTLSAQTDLKTALDAKQDALGFTPLSAGGGSLTGVGGNGFIGLPSQSANPSVPTTGLRLFADSSNRLSWIGQNGFVRTFDGSGLTASRVFTLPNSSGNVVVDTAAQTLSNKVLVSPTLSGGFLDANGVKVLEFGAVVSPVNSAILSNAAAGANPSIAMTGSDSDIGFKVIAKNAGGLVIGSDAINSDTITFKPNISGAGGFDMTFTTTDLTANRTVTFTDGTYTVVGTANTQTLTRKSFGGGTGLVPTIYTSSRGLNTSDYFVVMNGTGSTATLPDATNSTYANMSFIIKNINATNLTIATTGGQTIDGGANLTLTTNQVAWVTAVSGNWVIVFKA